ncbi:sulfatase family protein [Parapedobacter indicus]|uniref:Arylsulfatase A n=1 Tax=Parapedobacter indicus TaxID=1477437 RepID=A0A1I3CFS3_9SPHI|nr:sulfatase [Parapedobacter indicus]PPL04224.1 arylsulfatase A-like enzyme [Parapedobacter indicus]SFH73206.1 Arylsulfatase A [Parapedobacter indicus]
MTLRIVYQTGILMLLLSGCGTKPAKQVKRPNILVCIADDQSYPHAGAYGTKWIKTPAFDQVAREGILFANAYTPNAKCAPSRSCLLTGRNSWQLEEAANHSPFFPAKFKTYAEVLESHGYAIGYTGKGWAPGNPGTVDGHRRELLGPAFNTAKLTPPTSRISAIDYAANFREFMASKDADQPFCFWFGATEPHRPYEFGSGRDKGGKNIDEIDELYKFWPDDDSVRMDLLDYAYEIEHFDRQLANILEILKETGELDNTLILVTADNGMPFPRIKGQAYERSNHLPLAVMWKEGVRNPGRQYQQYVSFTDFAPTFLDVAGIDTAGSGMAAFEGNSLKPVLEDRKDAHVRDYMVIGKERHDVGRPHDWGYPIRGILKDNYLYLRNFEPTRWPAGNPETGYLNTDGAPTKSFILNQRRYHGVHTFWELNFGMRPEEELYNLSTDTDCVNNLAKDIQYAQLKTELHEILTKELEAEGDPRIAGNGAVFDQYIYSEERSRNFYERFTAGEDMHAGWVNESDFEPSNK